MDKFWKPLAESLSEPKDIPTLTIDDIEKHLEELKTIKPEYDPVAYDMLKRYVDALVKRYGLEAVGDAIMSLFDD